VKKNYKLIIILGVAFVALAVLALLLFLRGRARDEAPAGTDKTEEEVVASTTISATIAPTASAPSEQIAEKEEPTYDEVMMPIDYAIGELPVSNENFTIFYETDLLFFAVINARQGTDKEVEMIDKVEEWFTSRGVDMATIEIIYIYRRT